MCCNLLMTHVWYSRFASKAGLRAASMQDLRPLCVEKLLIAEHNTQPRTPVRHSSY